MEWNFILLSNCNSEGFPFRRSSKTHKESKRIPAKEIKDMPKWVARKKSDCPQTTFAAPIRLWMTMKAMDRRDKNLISQYRPSSFQL